MFNVKTFTFNPLGENTYVVSDADGAAVVIDCGALYPEECNSLAAYIDAEGLKPHEHLLTHAHFDHAFGAAFLYERYGLKPRCTAGDLPLLSDMEQQMRDVIGHAISIPSAPIGETLSEDVDVKVGQMNFRVLACPGHTAGGACFYEATERILFSGDSLFCGSIGRTDFPTGNHWELIRSLQRLLRILPDDIIVYPGHGPSTTIGNERRYNPYL